MNISNVFSSVANHEVSQVDVTTGIKHCHDNSHAQEDREREKKSARKRLYVASVVCLIFMIGEILGESYVTIKPGILPNAMAIFGLVHVIHGFRVTVLLKALRFHGS